MTFDGVLDLLTLGLGPGTAVVNQGFNIGMGLLESYGPPEEALLAAGLGREVVDMILNLTEDGSGHPNREIPGVKAYAKVEFVANLIQFGMLAYNKGGQIVSNRGNSSDVTNIKANEAFAKQYIISYEAP